MSEELAGLRRALAAAKTDEEYRRTKLENLVTAATTDIVAAALLTLELYMQSNRWPLIMLNATEAAGVDAKRALEMARKLIAKPALAEVEAWGPEELSEWLGREKMLSRLQPMALDGSITVRALLDAVVVGGDMKAVVPDAADVKAKVAVRAKLRNTVRDQLPVLVMPPAVAKMIEKSLHVEVAERPRDADAMMGPW